MHLNRRKEMEVSYNKLWKLMIDKGMSNKSDLRKVKFVVCFKVKMKII